MNPDAAMFAALAAGAAAVSDPPGSGATHMLTPIAPVMPYDVLTASQAAAYLQVSEDVVIQEAETGRLPGQKIGSQWRFLRLAIAEWLRSGQNPKAKPKSSKERMLAVAGALKDYETPEEYEAYMASILAYRDEIDRATGSGKYAPE